MNVDIEKMQAVMSRVQSDHPPFQIDGWLIITCGHALLAVRSDKGEPYSKQPEKLPKSAVNLIESNPLDSIYLSMEGVTSLCPVSTLSPCPKCGSFGRIKCKECEGTGQVECTCKCGDEHERDCDACYGTGGPVCSCGWKEIPWTPKNFVTIEQTAFNRDLISEYLYPLELPSKFRFNHPGRDGMLVIGDDDWRLAVMPYRASETEKLTYPRIELDAGRKS